MKATGYSRVSKNLIIGEIEKELKKSSVFFVTEHGAVSALAMDRLRAKLRAGNTRYLAVKKSLGRKALEKSNLPSIAESMNGACGIAFFGEDIVLSSKVLVTFAKENEGFKIQTGFLNGEIIGLDRIKALASLPSKEVLLSQVVGTIQAPLSSFVRVLSGTIRKVVTVFDAIAKKKNG